MALRGSVSANTRKNSMEVHEMLSHLLGIIEWKSEWSGKVLKSQELRVDERSWRDGNPGAGRRKILRKGCRKKMEEE